MEKILFKKSNIIYNKLNYNKFSKILVDWNRTENFRLMPWKGEKDPYKIWLSEIILQQTRVDQGLKYYNNFVNTYPTIKLLASADEQSVFKLWEGLGYYSRCKNLIHTAKTIDNELLGAFPNTYSEMLKLKGIGPYTAAAIASFAFNQPHAVVDGNVLRVLSRVFGITEPIDSTEGKKLFTNLAEKLLDKTYPGVYNQAIMDFGAIICKPANPICEECPFITHCIAFKKGLISQLPVKTKKITVKTRYFYFFIPLFKKQVPVKERTSKDIWQHLFQFPMIETKKQETNQAILQKGAELKWIGNEANPVISEIYSQKLSHQLIKSVFIHYKTSRQTISDATYKWIPVKDLQQFPFPKTLSHYISKTF